MNSYSSSGGGGGHSYPTVRPHSTALDIGPKKMRLTRPLLALHNLESRKRPRLGQPDPSKTGEARLVLGDAARENALDATIRPELDEVWARQRSTERSKTAAAKSRGALSRGRFFHHLVLSSTEMDSMSLTSRESPTQQQPAWQTGRIPSRKFSPLFGSTSQTCALRVDPVRSCVLLKESSLLAAPVRVDAGKKEPEMRPRRQVAPAPLLFPPRSTVV
ncbi:hypothetical protein CCHR01_19112 [Colletotrichum chrysophilum]|uniref:Uncharacterized protein n=1 Tax=Colletotrichum chrysophilum TaxID=1836956 RepID=A0AAD9E832_9PEZI|nr:hypothetical protein CCHR01_19112 [Colletotrichum chrysophilum]